MPPCCAANHQSQFQTSRDVGVCQAVTIGAEPVMALGFHRCAKQDTNAELSCQYDHGRGRPQDENTAVENAFVKIATAPNLAFEVRSDEERVTRIELARQRR